jgi:transcription initiation factor TFIID subunit TAF12
MALQRDTMSVINAMITQASTSRIPEADISEPQFEGRRSCCDAAPQDVNSKKHRDFATIMTPSNSSAAAERRTEMNRKQKAAT